MPDDNYLIWPGVRGQSAGNSHRAGLKPRSAVMFRGLGREPDLQSRLRWPFRS